MFHKDQETSIQYSKLMYELKELNKEIYLNKGLKMALTTKFKKSVIFKKNKKVELQDSLAISKKDFTIYLSQKRIAIYTCVFGAYDRLNEPVTVPDNCDFFVITDQQVKKESVWKKKNVVLGDFGLENKNNIEKNRFFKMFPHKVFKEYEYSIYIDGNVKVITDFTEFVNNMNPYGLSMHSHSSRQCVYKEINVCIKKKKDNKLALIRHREHIKKNGMPKNYGLLEATMIVREHNNEICESIMEQWWKEFTLFSKRDQISLPYILWKNSIEISEINLLGSNLYHNFAFRKYRHHVK